MIKDFEASADDAETSQQDAAAAQLQLHDAKNTAHHLRQEERQAENELLQALRHDESASNTFDLAQKRHQELAASLNDLKTALTEAEKNVMIWRTLRLY